MANNPQHNRRSIRLKGYDYSKQGLYFITVCSQDRICYFGQIKNHDMKMNDSGIMVQNEWMKLKTRFPNIDLHEFVVMPNHFHGIIEITAGASAGASVGASLVDAPATKTTLGDIMDAFKSITTVEYIRGVKNHGWQRFNKKLWQRNYWENIIRNNGSYERIANYIINNPEKWNDDSLK